MLIAIIGDLGSGKTLTLTFFAYLFYKSGKNVYANYHLNFPYVLIKDVNELNAIKEGGFFGDELWLWLDSRTSSSNRNKFASIILAKSRKRKLDVFYTTQTFMQIDIRVRKLTDIVIIPDFKKINNMCTVEIYNKNGVRLKKFSFNAEPFFSLYDTEEEINETINYDFYINQLLKDNLFKRLKDKKAKIRYIKNKFGISKDDAILIYDLYFSNQSSE